MKFKLSGIAVGVALMSSTSAFAAAPTLTEVFSASGITASGAVDVSYDWADVDGPVAGRQFDVNKDSFSLHQINLSVTKDIGSGFGATANLIYGDDAAITGGKGDDFDLFQGYLSYANGGFSASAGRFATLAGYEVVNPAGNINASRSILFFNQPFVHTGVRAGYKFGSVFAITAGVNNAGYGVGKVDTDTNTTAELQFAFTPTSSIGVFLTGYSGDQDGAPVGGGGVKSRADYVDLVASFAATDWLSFAVNADYSHTEAAGANEFKGVAGYTNMKFGKSRIALRAEYAEFDNGGAGTDWAREGTVTYGYSATDALELILEARQDVIDQGATTLALTPRDVTVPTANNDQITGTIKAIYKF